MADRGVLNLLCSGLACLQGHIFEVKVVLKRYIPGFLQAKKKLDGQTSTSCHNLSFFLDILIVV